MNWIYLYFVNKHRSRWPLLGLEVTFILSSTNASNLDQPELLSFGKELSEMIYRLQTNK